MSATQKDLSSELLLQLGEHIARSTGWRYSAERNGDLKKGLKLVSESFGFKQQDECARWIIRSAPASKQVRALSEHLTVGETYFFRDPKLFSALKTRVLPELISRRSETRRLRIWSAGCCTGEEPYTLAMILSRFPGIEDWTIEILGTDLNSNFLQRAARGRYTEWAFRATDASAKAAFFTKVGAREYELLPAVRKKVKFGNFNLSNDPAFSELNLNSFDLILCRNVLIYFDFEQAVKVVQRLHQALSEDGWLCVSPSELLYVQSELFSIVNMDGAIGLRKDNHHAYISQDSNEAIALPLSLNSMMATEEWLESLGSVATPAGKQHERTEPVCNAGSNDSDHSFQPTFKEALDAYEDGDNEQAAAILRELLESTPNVNCMILLARTLANQGKLEQALAWTDQALKQDKLNPVCHFVRATVLQELGRKADSISGLRQAIFLKPDFTMAEFSLGNLLLSLGKQQDATRHLRNALKLLERCPEDAVCPESGGLTVSKMTAAIKAIIEARKA